MLRVLIISDVAHGGAAIACKRLTLQLKKDENIQVKWLTAEGFDYDYCKMCNQWPRASTMAYWRIMRTLRETKPVLWRSLRGFNMWLLLHAVRRSPCDVINLHNIHATLTFGFVSRLPRVPIVWTLHDMWPLTGYCCYSYDCDKYAAGCEGKCPQWGKWGYQAQYAGCEWKKREHEYSLRKESMTLVSPSRWMAECANRRFNGKNPVVHIPYGFPLEVFIPLENQHSIRSELGLPASGRIVLIGSQIVDDPRKGYEYVAHVVRWLRASYGANVTIVAFGQRRGSCVDDVQYTGVINDPVILNKYYNAADLYLAPTLADNLPNTLIESMAAGTPCVAFETGGVPDIVNHMQNGYLARYRDSADLLLGVETLLGLSEDAMVRMRGHAHISALERFDRRTQAQSYINLYRRVAGASGEDNG